MKFTAAIRAELVERHSNYVAQGDVQRRSASVQFFEKLGLLAILNESERHGVIAHAVSRLWTVHQGMNNFYNEPPFAERLMNVSRQGAIPDTVQEEYVYVVMGCRMGNGYGVSEAAIPYYNAMIQAFSPREISIAISIPDSNGLVGRQAAGPSRAGFKRALLLIARASVPSGSQSKYDQYVQ